MNKIFIISDKNKKSQKIKNFLVSNIKKNPFKKLSLFIVVGGDGFMLQTLKRKINPNNIFYGINSGNYGFLMNKFSIKETIKNLPKAKMISISPLEMMVINKENKVKKSLAINEVSILRQSRQAASLQIKNGSKTIIKKLVSDGVLVSTPAGSTAYNLSVHGPILSLHSKKMSIAPISAFRPRRWRGKIISDKSNVVIKNLDIKKRPISAVADNFEVRKINKNKIQNYGWAISSAGEHYGGKTEKNKTIYEKYPLYKSHSEYGFIEPLKSFVPSIGVSEIVKIGQNKYVLSSMKDKSIYFFELNKQKQIINLNRVEVFERVRDLRFDNNQLYLFMEDTASIGVINLN